MKVVVPRIDLVSMVGKIQNIVPTKPSIPILVNVLVEAVDDQLIISATDLMLGIRIATNAKVFEEGAILIPARRFFQLARELTAPQIEIHTPSPEVAMMNAGSSHFKIHGIHKNEFPSLPDLSEGVPLELPAASFRELLFRCAFAAARDDTRPALNGVLMQNVQQVMTLMSTDGKHLAKIQTKVNLPPHHTGSYIIPIKTVEEMIRILDTKEEEAARITLMPDKIALEVKSITFISKLIGGQYPDVGRIIPEKTQTPIAIHREELISLLRQVSLFTSEERPSVRFLFLPGELHIHATSGEIGEGAVQMPVNYGGERLEIAFHPQYLLNILRHSVANAVDFSVTDSFNPGLITDSSTAQFIIMPMRLESPALACT